VTGYEGAMPLYIHDTLRRRKVEFVPRDPKRITMYVCGPTVYNYAHIGNARPVVVFDVLYRLLQRLYPDAEVIYARNFTDVDDKINAAAVAEGIDISVITNRFAEVYEADMAALNALPPTHSPRATHYIEAMADQIKRLIEADAAYVAEGHVLFRIAAFPDYGKLSGRSLDDMIAGARVEVAPYKEHPGDFVLWKPSKPGEPAWDAGGNHFPPGRPGWHIECSAMIEAVLGLPIDIHGGGHDLIFPHHENEIAQGRCATDGGEYARYWMHNGFLDFSGEKMSKSLGNVVLVHDLVKQYPGEVIRWALLSGHYRSPLDWTPELLEQSRASLHRLYGVLQRAKSVETFPTNLRQPPEETFASLLADLNTWLQMTDLFQVASELDEAVRNGADVMATSAKSRLLDIAEVLGVLQQDPDAWFEGGADDDLKAKVDALIAERVAARAAKDFAAADRIRDELTALNIVVMDGPTGATWRLKE
jgi:cysteinyl-tRNA synthetase